MVSAGKGCSQGWSAVGRVIGRDSQVLGRGVIRGGQCKEGV
jgi:hypothetical protein